MEKDKKQKIDDSKSANEANPNLQQTVNQEDKSAETAADKAAEQASEKADSEKLKKTIEEIGEFPVETGSKHRHVNTITLWVLIIVALIIGAGFLTISSYMVKGSDKDVTIMIPKDATKEMVKDSLLKYFPEDYTGKVMNLFEITGFKPSERHGAYTLPAGATPFATMRKISRGSQSPIRLTINGFRSLDYLAERISKKMEFSKEDFLAVARKPEFLAQYGLDPENALSLFFDDTYEVYWTSSPEEVLKKIGDNYQSYWSEGRKQQAADLDVTPAQMMVLASIVEEETNQQLEKGRIGRLYLNRLDANMKLQADPTVKFALKDPTIRRVTNQHLKVDSPYNTYMHEGLPPGPLRTTSRKTVSDILNSQPSTDLYMCAREDFSGFHNFASTYEEHLENARRYQNELNERGIK